ncbi:MAG: hypothetical protein WC310_02625 [Patescibacteria group bacterium]|jgi:hypothetical protein
MARGKGNSVTRARREQLKKGMVINVRRKKSVADKKKARCGCC